jgi:hypothetical protein
MMMYWSGMPLSAVKLAARSARPTASALHGLHHAAVMNKMWYSAGSGDGESAVAAKSQRCTVSRH